MLVLIDSFLAQRKLPECQVYVPNNANVFRVF